VFPTPRRTRMSRLLLLAIVALSALLTVPAVAPAAIADAQPSVEYEGMQKLKFKMGPFRIKPGQNEIAFRGIEQKPTVPGYITRFEPNIERPDGTVPGVDVIHLHHAVWLARNYPMFAAGEEKTIYQFPKGFGYRHDPSDSWGMTDMIHNLMPNDDQIVITWEVDFVPLDSPAGRQIQEVQETWMDVAGLKAYPVFDARREWGRNGTFTFPDQVRTAKERAKVGPAQSYVVPEDMTVVWTAGHLHPGGLYTDLKVTRDGQTRNLFRSVAKYWEPAGAVSWDVAMTASKPTYRAFLKKGDKVTVHATYDTSKASWYESMGIVFMWWAKGVQDGAVDPFTGVLDTTGDVTHGHLAENDNHGGKEVLLPDARRMLSARGARSSSALVEIANFVYRRGDLSLDGNSQRPPTIRPGQSLTFKNTDAGEKIYHTITACKAPCNRDTGVAYPLANGNVDFDSGELGFGPRYATPTENRDTWTTPKSLGQGTYTYFCRVHPFMRGAFRVKKSK
jgi:plastocyanin